MCGRFTLSWPAPRLAQWFDATEGDGLRETYQPSFNIAPTRYVAGLVITAGGSRLLEAFRWGLVPPWAPDPSIGNRLFNARAETLDSKPAFAEALTLRRVVIVAEGFYEWRAAEGQTRHQPFLFRRPDGKPLLFAGLWEAWRAPAGPKGSDDRLLTCTIITTAAGEDMAGIHDRMPAILGDEALPGWLEPGRIGRSAREELLRPAPPGTLVHHRVDPRVGDVRQDDPQLVVPFTPPLEPEPLRLFT
ncbi:MAG: SOS response-associated peptidase [Actinomycetota bacterium]|nr:SOS response-associated peptidase [Actinomycetota bacterium]